jgi:hypothetical protein
MKCLSKQYQSTPLSAEKPNKHPLGVFDLFPVEKSNT